MYLYNRAQIHQRSNDFERAERLYETALTSYEGPSAEAYRARALNSLATLYAANHELERAEDTCLQAVDAYTRFWGAEHPCVATGLADLGRIQLALGKPVEAESTVRRAIEIRRQITPPIHWLTAYTQGILAECLRNQGRSSEAIELLTASHQVVEAALGASDWRTQELADTIASIAHSAPCEEDHDAYGVEKSD